MDMPARATKPWHHCAVLLWMLGFLVATEVALEWRAEQRGFDTLLFSHDDDPAIIGSPPFRNPPVSQIKSPGTLRLWLMGASHAQDVYQPLDVIFPNRICAHLDFPCELINASDAGADLTDNLVVFNRYADHYQPDLVLIYQGSIEIQALSKQAFSGQASDATSTSSQSVYSSTLSAVRRAFESTTVFAHLTQEIRTRLMAAKQLQNAIPESEWQAFRERMKRSIEQIHSRGAQVALITFAARYREQEVQQFSDELFRSQLRYNPHLSKQGWLNSIKRLNSELELLATALELPLIRIAEQTSGQEQFFRDFSHFSRAGHEHVAQKIAQQLHWVSPPVEALK